MTFYTSNTWVAGPVSKEFEKKYPFVKANVWRSDSKELLKRLTEEVTAARFLADVVETSPEYIAILMSNKMLQEYLSPELSRLRRRCKNQRQEGSLRVDQPRDLYQPGFQHQAHTSSRSAKNDQGLSRP